MQPISDFDERFQILRSLVIRNELPENWYTDEAYSVSFRGSDERVTKVTITIQKDDVTIVREYEPIIQQSEDDSSEWYMLKTSEVQLDSVEPQN